MFELKSDRLLLVSTTLVAIIASAAVILAMKGLPKSSCLEVRAGFDVGSGSTKMVVAKVDFCQQRLLQILDEAQEKTDFQEDLNKSEHNTLSMEMFKKAVGILTSMKERARIKGAVRFYGYATQSFRSAQNGSVFISQLALQAGIPLQIVSQAREAALGRFGVMLSTGRAFEHLAIWDIGGGSQQLTVPSESDALVFEGRTASVGFRDIVISEIKKQDPKSVTTPNPLNEQEIQLALDASQKIAESISDPVRLALHQPKVEVIGIGGVHWYSIRAQTGTKEVYTQEDVEKTLQARVDKTDAELQSPFASTEVTNLIFVLGHMKNLGIKQVRPMKINLSIPALFVAGAD